MWCRVSSGQVPITNDSRAAAQLDGVVGHEAVAADDQIERALALADAALADDQHAEAEDVHAARRGRRRGRPGSVSSTADRRAIASGVAARRAEQRHAGRGPPRRRLPAAASNPPVTSRHGQVVAEDPPQDAARRSSGVSVSR